MSSRRKGRQPGEDCRPRNGSIPSLAACRTARPEKARKERKSKAQGPYADSKARAAATSTGWR
ncbi:hypothetical protein Ari01nite_61330 [Paractinoplanes rishiriensis]|uniref:Uncharacterized protein n=1 Tax=Paractinoplanes rishiriensis TaxID=1050105 RepID=A0A919K1Q5_9ACTN|nr:hypothetical protein Ari01nite_61330 [Actinoplanes rishiriensis]